MATRAAAYAAGSDAGPAGPSAHPSAPSGSASDAASNAPAAAAQLAPQPAIDASAYEPSATASISASAYANAAAVAASTAVLTPATHAATRSRAVAAPSQVATTLPSSALSAPPTPTQAPSAAATPHAAMALAPPPALLARSGKLSSARPSSKFGTVNYSVDEMRRLNDKIRAVMPIASDDWLHVAYQFNYMRPESIPYREVESLKRKFKKMYCARASGGKLPDYAQEAKELRRQINQRSERAQIQLESVHSDSQSEVDAQDATLSTQSSTGGGGGGSDDVAASAEIVETSTASVDTAELATADASMDAAESSTASGMDIAARLRLMEDEYHRSMATKRSSSATPSAMTTSTDGLNAPGTGAMSALYMDGASSTAVMPGFGALGGVVANEPSSTTGIINLLKHSIERKRRTIEEQMLSESERVRKERKKRKMEQVLYNIHREQTGADVGSAGGLAGGTSGAAFQHNLLATAAAAASPSASSGGPMPPVAAASALIGQDTSTSLGVMEIVLQFLIAQQQETARRDQLDDERRRIEAEERERRRRHKDAQRRKDKHEMMLVMAALLQENFPVELRQYLDPGHSESISTSDDSGNGNTLPPNGTAAPKPKTSDVPGVDRAVVEEAALL